MGFSAQHPKLPLFLDCQRLVHQIVCGKRVWFSGEIVPRYLQKRRRRWYAVLDVPKALRPALGGTPRFVESLQTESLTEAERLVPLVIARWKAELDDVRSGTPRQQMDVKERALGWRDAIDSSTDDERDAIQHVLSDQVEMAERSEPGSGVALYRFATRQWVDTSEHVEEWLSTLDNEPKTKDMKRSDLSRFSSRFRLTSKVGRKEVQRWVYDLQHEEGLKLATIRRIISACRGYWSHLQRLDVVPDDVEPFRDVVPKSKRRSKGEVADLRKPFSNEDVVRLLREAVDLGDMPLARLIWLGMWTGCRIEELCSLRLQETASDRLRITDAKSEAGWREVPVHSSLAPAIEWLRAHSTDAFLLDGLGTNKYDDRSNAIGKRFGRLKTKLGHGKHHVFHSLRYTVTTQLDAAGVPEAVTARIVGHEIQTMTYGVYSGGAPFEVKQAAIENLRYPLQTEVVEKLFDFEKT
ncbi:MAG: tyrosine-type recombinase/integrase [Sulfitobacter sp.]|uniref:tyrosine-type recombinase/integrase n=1 Tax=unclassified Sulfitobacter TaxID=196795 RepID=UPI002943360B|nr:tyrosine-type recombinase/integrase [Sulfitobacter sp. LC.270.F.C4]WOI14522.1 tyrosine-type recombinase/integrase [Sulfitobacter sp. LC.270.F.C4]